MSSGMTRTIEIALAKRYAAPEYAFLLQVRNGTGFQRTVRTADALAFGLYPSRGLTITGFEIKASRGDWKRELTNPDKAEDIARFCHTWFVVAPKGVVPVDEVPPNWGLQELYDSGRLITTKAAEPKEPEPLTPLMIASIMRSVEKGMIPRSSIQQQVDDAVAAERERGEREIEHRTKEYTRLKASIAEFEDASGIRISHWQAGDIGEAVRVVLRHRANPAEYLYRLRTMRDGLQHLDAQIEQTIAQFGQVSDG